MEIYRRKINIDTINDSQLISWLKDFLIYGKYYNVGRRGDRVSLYPSDLLVSEVDGKIRSLADILSELYGIYSSEDEAIAAAPPCPKIVMVHQNADEFYELFTDINGAKDCINGVNSVDCDNGFVFKGTAQAVSSNGKTITVDGRNVRANASNKCDVYYVDGEHCEYVSNGVKWIKIGIFEPIFLSETIRDIGIYEDIDEDHRGLSGETFYDIPPISGISETDDDRYSTDPIEQESKKKYAESQLQTLTRRKISYDENGNPLPYYYNEEERKCELPYVIGEPHEITYEPDGGYEIYFYNVLKSVTYKDENGEECAKENGETIVFEYYVRSSVSESGVCNGVLYKEEHKYTLEDEPHGTKYVAIGESLTIPDDDFVEETSRGYAEIEGIMTDSDTLSWNPIVKNEAFMHIHDYNIDHDDVYIERGTSASYEAFNVLGEVNTMEDIERYRDDWFRIKGKND